MRRILSWASWLIIAPLFAASVTFALNNKSLMALDLWPFGLTIELPIYLAMFAVLGVGVIMGGIVAWLGQGRVRSNLRAQAYESEVTRRALKTEREKLDALTKELNSAKSTPVAPIPSSPAPDLRTQETLPPPQSIN